MLHMTSPLQTRCNPLHSNGARYIATRLLLQTTTANALLLLLLLCTRLHLIFSSVERQVAYVQRAGLVQLIKVLLLQASQLFVFCTILCSMTGCDCLISMQHLKIAKEHACATTAGSCCSTLVCTGVPTFVPSNRLSTYSDCSGCNICKYTEALSHALSHCQTRLHQGASCQLLP